jgi:hypothetical protein
MIDPEELPDYIFNELLPASKLYHEEKKYERLHILNIHINESVAISKTAVSSFVNKVKGVIRRDECCYLEVEGPLYITQTCFICTNEHTHVQIIVVTDYDL